MSFGLKNTGATY
jgi:hypothetical protein